MLVDASFIELGRFGKFRCFLTFHDVSTFDSEHQKESKYHSSSGP